MSKRSDQLFGREDRLVVARAPAEQREVVADGARQVARGAQLLHRRRPVALGELAFRRARAAAAGGRSRGGSAPSAAITSSCLAVLVRWSLPRITCVISSLEVVDGDREVVDGFVGAGDHESSSERFGVLDLPEHESVNDVSPSSGTRSRTAPSASSRPRNPRSSPWSRLNSGLLRSRSNVRAPAVEQPLTASRWAARSPIGGSAPRPSRARASAGLEDLLDVLGRRALAVGIFDAQHEAPACAAGQQPVEQRRAGAADVQRAGRGRSEADSHGRCRMLVGAHVRPRAACTARRARHCARRARDPDLQPVAARVAPHGLRRGGLRALSRGDRGQRDRRGPDPRRVPAQLRLRGPGDPREDARLADPFAARRRRHRRARRRRAPGIGEGGRPPPRSRARARCSRRRSPSRSAARFTSRTPPARAARSGVRSRSSGRCSRRAAADRGSACALTPATCSRPATTSARRPAGRGDRRLRGERSAPGGSGRCTSTIRGRTLVA